MDIRYLVSLGGLATLIGTVVMNDGCSLAAVVVEVLVSKKHASAELKIPSARQDPKELWILCPNEGVEILVPKLERRVGGEVFCPKRSKACYVYDVVIEKGCSHPLQM